MSKEYIVKAGNKYTEEKLEKGDCKRLTRCKDCIWAKNPLRCPLNLQAGGVYKHDDDWFCADGQSKETAYPMDMQKNRWIRDIQLYIADNERERRLAVQKGNETLAVYCRAMSTGLEFALEIIEGKRTHS